MTALLLFVTVAAITYVSRAIFMIRPRDTDPNGGPVTAFPLALFVSLATVGAVAPAGSFELRAPLIVSVLGAAILAATQRVGLLLVMICGYGLFWGWTWLS